MQKSSKYTAKQPDDTGHIPFDDNENEVWSTLYHRQIEIVKNRAHPAYLEGHEKLALPSDRVPQCHEVSEKLQKYTGWSVVPVPVLIPLEEFFRLLANRQFPAASFIRYWEDLDYIQEPDIFHEIFGHCPLLTHPAYAEFMQHYGKMCLETTPKIRTLLGRVYWFTIEFGLIQTNDGLRVYGGGILSSPEETVYALESDKPERVAFDAEKAMQTPYRYDQLQTLYYVIDDFDTLFQLTNEDLIGMAEKIEQGQQDSFRTC